MTTRTIAIVAIVLWAASAAFVGYKFMAGSTLKADDGREAIVLEAGERDFILAEMRGMLVAVHDIIGAANAGDMEAVKEIAHRVGVAEVEGVPPQTMLKLPMAFKQMGRATHEGFDEVGLAADMGPEAVLGMLEDNMNKCIGCHEAYKFTTQ